MAIISILLCVFQIMRYLVYFPIDKQVLELEECDILLGPYEGLTLEDWKSVDEAKVKCLYDKDVFDGVILQVSYIYMIDN